MTVASEISRLQQAKADLKAAITAKGVSVADSDKLDVYGDKVAAIPDANKKVMKTRIFTQDGTFKVPAGVNKIYYRIFGGGGGGSRGAGGGGHMKAGEATVTAGSSYPITIGDGGTGSYRKGGTAGGVTSIGTLASASGGSPGDNLGNGGDGGSGGGAGNGGTRGGNGSYGGGGGGRS